MPEEKPGITKSAIDNFPATLDAGLLTRDDLYLFNEGTHSRLYRKMGAHPGKINGKEGAFFAVWAPDARRVSVIGDFNGWQKGANPLFPRGRSGVWEGFIPGVKRGDLYKYHIVSRYNNYRVDKADPYAFYAETSPKTASVVWAHQFDWNDAEWMEKRREKNAVSAPIAIYEVHPGSWRRSPKYGHPFLSYRELAVELVPYVKEAGFTHVEFMPVMEHPFYGSWGYQVTGYFTPTARYGTPEDFMYLLDAFHRDGIGVILDWVPSHFPNDEFGLGFFDGTHLYEHADVRQGIHPDWNSCIFNYSRSEVRSFLLSSALFWLDVFHADGLRVDAVASMVYLDYSRKKGEWVPNKYGGHENLEAIDFLRRFNETTYTGYPDVQTIAEESTAWPMVTRPPYVGGLGFGFKWDMGWMHDTLEYMGYDPLFRKYHQNNLTFRVLYAWSENFILPLSHDEVVHGKGSLLSRLPGDDWQKFANLRLLFGYMYTMPGKKLLFMGGEFGVRREWNHDGELDWHLLEYDRHRQVKKWVGDLNRLYAGSKALHELDADPAGFEWIDCADADNSVISYIRKGTDGNRLILVACNFTPVSRENYLIGVPRGGHWREVLNSDAAEYGGSGMGNKGGTVAHEVPQHNRPFSVNLTLPPLSVVVLESET
jgi:1,4-alpha-glucan branching enzyme